MLEHTQDIDIDTVKVAEPYTGGY
jgi:hypothetical protein